MGGVGSGRKSQFGKDTTEDMRAIDIRKLQREGWLKAGQSITLTWSRRGQRIADIKMLTHEDYINLVYRTRTRGKEEWQDKNDNVVIERTPCHYGGFRVWFRCPCCDKRVAVIYGGKVFACRYCHHLVYESQKENELDRLSRKVDKIRERLHWEGGILNGGGRKPKGMHHRTFYRLKAKHNQLENKIYSQFKYLGYLGCLD